MFRANVLIRQASQKKAYFSGFYTARDSFMVDRKTGEFLSYRGIMSNIVYGKYKPPFPWFGGKSRVSNIVWDALGNVESSDNLVCDEVAMWNYAGVKSPIQPALLSGRVLVWFSCGAASAFAAKNAVQKYKDEVVEVVYCNTLKYEHPDNIRFMNDVSGWIGQPIKILNPWEYTGYYDIYDVFNRTGWLVGPGGARCTTELKKRVRLMYQNPEDLNIFGFTAEEEPRIARFQKENNDIFIDWNLMDSGITKKDCLRAIAKAGIEIPAMYKLGYRNNNCEGCVKGKMGYWNKIRRDFPNRFHNMSLQERKMGVSIIQDYYLDELPENKGRYEEEEAIECGPLCGLSGSL